MRRTAARREEARREEVRSPRLTTGSTLSPIEQLKVLARAEGLADMTAAEGAAVMLDLAAMQQALDDVTAEMKDVIGSDAIIPLMPESQRWLADEDGRIVIDEERFASDAVEAMRADGERPGDVLRTEVGRLMSDGADRVRPSVLYPKTRDVEALLRCLEMADFKGRFTEVSREAVCRATDEVFEENRERAEKETTGLVDAAVNGYITREFDLKGYYGEVFEKSSVLFEKEIGRRTPFAGCRDRAPLQAALGRLAAKMLMSLDRRAAVKIDGLCRTGNGRKEGLEAKMKRVGLA